MRRAAAVAALLALAGCGPSERPAEPTGQPAEPPPQSAPPFAPAADAEKPLTPTSGADAASADWTRTVKPADRDRLVRLSEAWRVSLADARRSNAAEVAALGALTDPEAGLPRPHPAPGVYRCRTVKLGSPAPVQAGMSRLAYVAYPFFRCRIELTPGGDLTLAKQTGSQRGTGQFFPERDVSGADTNRLIFLGAQAWGSDEASAPAYGRDPDRDQIGVLERIGSDRYRLALPWPRQESTLDLLELERVGN